MSLLKNNCGWADDPQSDGLTLVPGIACSKLILENRNTRTSCEICSKSTIKTPCSSVSIVNFEHVNTDWDKVWGQ